MPNHVMNKLRFENLTEENQDFIIQMITTPGDATGMMPSIDFDKIIPEPRTKEECPEDCLATPDSHIVESERKTMVRLVQVAQ